jgi:membrane-associated protein
MTYGTFAAYNVIGGALWVVACVGAGYMFGNIDVVKNNFELVVIGIIAVSILPMVIEVFRQWQTGKKALKP